MARGGSGAKAPPLAAHPEVRKGTHTHTHSEPHVKENQTGSQLKYAKKEGVERNKERRNCGRVIGGRGEMERSGVKGNSGRMTGGRGTRRKGTGRRWEGGGGGGEDGVEGGGWVRKTREPQRKEHEKKGERWGEGKERWRRGEGETCMREEGEGKGGSSRNIRRCCPLR